MADTVKMVRDEPMAPNGPVTADVHPEEVANMTACGWVLAMTDTKATTAKGKKSADAEPTG